jgi:hypothetical protein
MEKLLKLIHNLFLFTGGSDVHDEIRRGRPFLLSVMKPSKKLMETFVLTDV